MNFYYAMFNIGENPRKVIALDVRGGIIDAFSEGATRLKQIC